MRKTPNMIIYRVQFLNRDTNLTGDKTAILQQKKVEEFRDFVSLSFI